MVSKQNLPHIILRVIFLDDKFFLAANSADGFYSTFDKSYDVTDGWRAYIIKGGPGTGKSTLMKRLAKKAENRNIEYVLCPCSSDPDSLDAVIFPTIKRVIMDGTAPHTVDPKFPGICEEIINFGQFWNTDKLLLHHNEILNLTNKNSALHKLTALYIKTMGSVCKSSFSYALAATDIEKCINFAVKTAQKNIPFKKGTGKKWVRFLGGITPKGALYYTETVNNYKNKIILNDNFGAASSIILSAISDIAISRGHEIIVIKNALLPNDITDALLIPELSLCICREYQNIKFESNTRRIHYGRFTDKVRLNSNKQKIQFGKKIHRRLLQSATETLANAKSTHDELEKFYINAMDFDKMKVFCDEFIANFFK